MAEQNTTTAAVVALFSTALSSEHGVILLAALAGASWPLSSTTTETRTKGAFLLLRLVGTSFMLTGAVSWLAEKYLGIPSSKATALVAWALAAFGSNWTELIAAIKDRLKALISGGSQQ